MKSVDEHLADVLAAVGPLPEFDLNLLDAHGCVLAEDVVGVDPLPRFDNSSMDGYAVRVTDVVGASPERPVVLPVTGDVAAGSTGAVSLQPGLCVRIMTGAPMPAGADAVVPVEWTDGGIANVAVTRGPETGAYVRRAGEDLRPGDLVLPAGSHLGAVSIGLLAAVGRATVRVRPKPRVVVISTGSELVDTGEPLRPGAIYDSNSYMLTAAAREAGAIAYRVGIVPDDPRRLLDTLEDHLIRADVLVTSGGVSVGAYDVVKEVLSRLGTVSFESVAMQPGKPQAFGTIGPDATPVFGLPGNPVSALVSFEAFVRPALRAMLGAVPVERPKVRAAATEALRSPAGKRSFLRVSLDVRDGAYAVTPVSGAGSHLLAGMARANALAMVPEDVEEVPVGGAVEVLVLERRGR